MARHRDGASGGHAASGSRWKLTSLNPKNIDAISRIEHQCFRLPWSRQSIESVLTQKTYKALGAHTALGELIGYGMYTEVADELHILNLAVHPDHRRQGVGSCILGEIHQKAYANGRRMAFLEVRESNSIAQYLYKKFKYTRLSKRLNYYEDDREDALLMRAQLKGPNR